MRCTLFCCPWVWGTFGFQLSHQTLISSEGRSDWWSPTCLPFTISSPAASSCLSIPQFQHSLCNHCKSSTFCSKTGLQGTQCVDVQCRFNTWATWIWFFGFGFVSPGRGNLNHSTSKDDTAFFKKHFWHFIYFFPHAHIFKWGKSMSGVPCRKVPCLIYQLFLQGSNEIKQRVLFHL